MASSKCRSNGDLYSAISLFGKFLSCQINDFPATESPCALVASCGNFSDSTRSKKELQRVKLEKRTKYSRRNSLICGKVITRPLILEEDVFGIIDGWERWTGSRHNPGKVCMRLEYNRRVKLWRTKWSGKFQIEEDLASTIEKTGERKQEIRRPMRAPGLIRRASALIRWARDSIRRWQLQRNAPHPELPVTKFLKTTVKITIKAK